MDDAIEMSLATLRAALPASAPPSGNWFDSYKWDAAEVE
jgi:hypothetical protein